jgi:hypothetical protein
MCIVEFFATHVCMCVCHMNVSVRALSSMEYECQNSCVHFVHICISEVCVCDPFHEYVVVVLEYMRMYMCLQIFTSMYV